MDYLEHPGGDRIAYELRPGRAPTLVFLPGYMSDMTGGKAAALDGWAGANGQAMLRLDYRGCGASDGAFEDFTLADWLDDVLAAIDRLVAGSIVLIGSSMGGWLALLAALARPERVGGLVGIAAAPDFTDWGFDEGMRARLSASGRLVQPSQYGNPLIMTLPWWRSAQERLLLGGEIAIDRPVRLLQGQQDGDVPWATALRLAETLRSADVQTILIKDGDHRLSRERDLHLLVATVARLVEEL